MRNINFYLMSVPALTLLVEGMKGIHISTHTDPVGVTNTGKARAYSIFWADDLNLPADRLISEIRYTHIRAYSHLGNPEASWAAVVNNFGEAKFTEVGSFAVTAADFSTAWLKLEKHLIKGVSNALKDELGLALESKEMRHAVGHVLGGLPRIWLMASNDSFLSKSDTEPDIIQVEVMRGSNYKITSFADDDGVLKQLWKGVSISVAPSEIDVKKDVAVVASTGVQQVFKFSWEPDLNAWYDGLESTQPKPYPKFTYGKKAAYQIPDVYLPFFWKDGFTEER